MGYAPAIRLCFLRFVLAQVGRALCLCMLCRLVSAAPLTFSRAVQLAAENSTANVVGSTTDGRSDQTGPAARSYHSNDTLMGSLQRCASGLPLSLDKTEPTISNRAVARAPVHRWQDEFESSAAESKARAGCQQTQRKEAMLDAALAYIRVATVTIQASVAQKQSTAAERLLKIESLRVARKVDDPVVLTRAKLAAAWTSMRQADLAASELRLRRQLSSLTGLLEQDIKPSSDSIPVFADAILLDAANAGHASEKLELEATAKKAGFARDMAQLDYVLARRETARVDAKVETGDASPGDQALAYINEYSALGALLDATLDLQSAQLRLLSAGNRLEEWASADNIKPQSAKSKPLAMGALQPQVPSPSGTSAFVASMMIVPNVSELAVGQTRQFSLILIYSDGTTKVVSSEAVWRCSCNWTAIVSTSGLVTALLPGEVTVAGTVSGLSGSRTIKITPDDHRVY